MFPVPEKLSTTLYVSELRKRLFDGVSLSQCASRSASDTEEDDTGPRKESAVLTAAAEQLKHNKELEEKTKRRVKEQKRQEAEEAFLREKLESEQVARAARESEERARLQREADERAQRAARVQEALQKEMTAAKVAVTEQKSPSESVVFAAPAPKTTVAEKVATLRRSGSTAGEPGTLRRSGSTAAEGGSGSLRGEGKNTPRMMIAAVASNDPTVEMVDLSGNTMFLMKHREYTKELSQALARNSFVKEVHLKSVDLDKVLCRCKKVCLVSIKKHYRLMLKF
jgi:flagellar biosynthesis GTPase FlhF